MSDLDPAQIERDNGENSERPAGPGDGGIAKPLRQGRA